MADEKKIIGYDYDGYEEITVIMRDLLNLYPGLTEDEEIAFATLPDSNGKAMYPISSAVIQDEKEDITGHVKQICLYPIYVVYRASGLTEERRVRIKEWLDNLGRWLERQTVRIEDRDYKLTGYPDLNGARRIISISRQTPAYLDSINENQSENWVIYISARYKNEFDR